MTIIVPYRDREQQLDIFIDHMFSYLPGVRIVVIEQATGKPFNRAKLLNIGVLEFPDDYYVMHDVDMLPVKVDYTPIPGVTQLAGSDIQQQGYLGGVTMFDAETFFLVDGYPNLYFHRGEDNLLMFTMIRLGVRWKERHGTFKMQAHVRPDLEFIPWIWVKAQLPRKPNDGVSGCKYVIADQISEHHIIVDI